MLTYQWVEFCYNIRYFELNGRGRGNPWSLRQTGVYQRCFSNKRSAWLLLNYSSYIGDRVAAAFGEESNSIQGSCEVPPLWPHLFILSAATRNWGQYIEDLRRKVMRFVRARVPLFWASIDLPPNRKKRHIRLASMRSTWMTTSFFFRMYRR
jgi:hypothetical protein